VSTSLAFHWMQKEPQQGDRVKTPKGKGTVVARSQTIPNWLVGVRLDKDGSPWFGSADEVELLEAANERSLRDAT
jgi:hypothetical protein